MSIKKPYESWHAADMSRPLKAHGAQRRLPDSTLFVHIFICCFIHPCCFIVSPHILLDHCRYLLSHPILYGLLCHSLSQDLEEELELDRRRVSEAEGVAKRAEEELTVAKERLLLQEDELQSRAGSRCGLPPAAGVH